MSEIKNAGLDVDGRVQPVDTSAI